MIANRDIGDKSADEVDKSRLSEIRILQSAIRYERGNVVSELLSHKYKEVNRQDKSLCTLLHYTAWFGEIVCAKELLNQRDINVNLKDNTGKTPLHFCSRHNTSTDVVVALLERKDIQVNATDSEGKTPLHHAVLMENSAVVAELRKHPDIQVNVYDTSGKTPLHYAAAAGLDRIVAELLQHPDIQVNVEDKEKNTALRIAGLNKFGRVAGELLKDQKLRAELNNVHDFTAIQCAITFGYSEEAKKFLKNYVKDYPERRKNRPLHWSARLFGISIGVSMDDKISAAKFLLENIDNPREIENLAEFPKYKDALDNGELGKAYTLINPKKM